MAQVGNPQAAGKVSKNQRSGPRAAQQARQCGKGHEIQRVLVVPVKGPSGMRDWCPCVETLG